MLLHAGALRAGSDTENRPRRQPKCQESAKRPIVALLLAGLALLVFSQPAPGGEGQCRVYEWVLTGVVVGTGTVGPEGYYHALTLRREIPEQGGEEYLEVYCEQPTPIFPICQSIELFESIRLGGYVRSNEPFTGSRLSVRAIERLGTEARP